MLEDQLLLLLNNFSYMPKQTPLEMSVILIGHSFPFCLLELLFLQSSAQIQVSLSFSFTFNAKAQSKTPVLHLTDRQDTFHISF